MTTPIDQIKTLQVQRDDLCDEIGVIAFPFLQTLLDADSIAGLLMPWDETDAEKYKYYADDEYGVEFQTRDEHNASWITMTFEFLEDPQAYLDKAKAKAEESKAYLANDRRKNRQARIEELQRLLAEEEQEQNDNR